MTADPWSHPDRSWAAQPRPRLVAPDDLRSAVATGMAGDDEVHEVEAFLDQVEVSVEQMLGEVQALRRRIAAADRANEARMYDIRVALERLLVRLGGPTGAPSGVIDPEGRDVPLYSVATPAGPAMSTPPPPGAASGFAPPRGPVNDSPPPPMSAPYGAPPRSAPLHTAPPTTPTTPAAPGQPAFAAPPPFLQPRY